MQDRGREAPVLIVCRECGPGPRAAQRMPAISWSVRQLAS